MMRPDHWLAYPPNRYRASKVGGAGTVIAAAAASLIAGLSQHSSGIAPPSWHQVTDAALNSITPVTTTQEEPALRPTSVPEGARKAGADEAPHSSTTASPVPDLSARQAPAAATDDIGGPRHDDDPTQTTVPAITAPAPLASSGAGSKGVGSSVFRPYVHNGTTGTATQTTSGPSGTTTITTNPTTISTSSPGATNRTDGRDDQHISTPSSTSVNPTIRATNDKRSETNKDASEHHGEDDPDRTPVGTASNNATGRSGAAAYNTQTTGDSRSEQVATSSDLGSRSRVAQALPPGFTPSEPRQTRSDSTTSPASSATQGTQPAPPGPITDSPAPTATAPASSGAIQSGAQYQPAPSGLAQSGPVSGSGSPTSTTLTQVACPAVVANATCYQQVPVSGSSSPLDGASSTQGSPPSVPTIHTAAPAAAPTALPSTGLPTIPSSTPTRSASSGDCQASGNHTDSTARAQTWGDLSQLIMDRIQDCIEQGMSVSRSGWDTTTSTGKSKTSNKPAPASSESDSSSSSKKRHHNN